MQSDALFGDGTVQAAVNRFAARMRPRGGADSADLFAITILMGSMDAGITAGDASDGVQGLIPIPMRGRPVGWMLDEVLDGSGDMSVQLEYAPPTTDPVRSYSVFTATEMPVLASASTASGPFAQGIPMPGWPTVFEARGIIRPSVLAEPSGTLKWVLLTIMLARLPLAAGLPA